MADHHYLYGRKGSILRKGMSNPREAFFKMLEERRKRNLINEFERTFEDKHKTAIEFIEGDMFTVDHVINKAGVGAFHAKLIIIACISWIAVGILVVFGSYISHLATCTFKMKPWYNSALMVATTCSRTLGSVFFGVCADKYGRRTVLSICSTFAFSFGCASSGVPNHKWFIIFQSITAFNLGGLSQALTMCCEYLPKKYRGRVIFMICTAFVTGQVLLLGMIYSPRTGDKSSWRFFTLSSSLPACVIMFMTKYFPESVRFLLVSDKLIPANKILEEIFKENKKIMPRGRLYSKVDSENRGKLHHLFHPPYRRSFLIFIFISYATAMCRNMMMLHKENPHIHETQNNSSHVTDEVEVSCSKMFENDVFLKRVLVEAMCLPGYLVFLIVVDFIDRKKLLGISCIITSFSIFLLLIKKSILTEVSSFVARAILAAELFMNLLMTAETCPTTLRGTATGIISCFITLGVLTSVFLFEALNNLGEDYIIGFCGLNTLLCAFVVTGLTKETRNMKLTETAYYED